MIAQKQSKFTKPTHLLKITLKRFLFILLAQSLKININLKSDPCFMLQWYLNCQVHIFTYRIKGLMALTTNYRDFR